jgi:hypothetical protein
MSYYGDGKFEFIKNKNEKELYINAWNAITKNELWVWLGTYEPENGFIWASHPNLDKINNEIHSSPIGQSHSGLSYGLTMRTMQNIAKNGYENYRNKILSYYIEEENKRLVEYLKTIPAPPCI